MAGLPSALELCALINTPLEDEVPLTAGLEADVHSGADRMPVLVALLVPVRSRRARCPSILPGRADELPLDGVARHVADVRQDLVDAVDHGVGRFFALASTARSAARCLA